MYLGLFGLRLRHHDVFGCTGCSYHRELDELSYIQLASSVYDWSANVSNRALLCVRVYMCVYVCMRVRVCEANSHTHVRTPNTL